MPRKIHLLLFLLLPALFLVGCKSDPAADTVEFTFLQINDVYEINALEGGNVGGMSRVKSLLDTLEAENPYTYAFLAGDFLNPSAMGTVKYEGKSLKGRQMVDVMNETGIDYVTFGNHEFDIKEQELQDRIDESKFQWITSNVEHVLNSDNDSLENDTVTWFRNVAANTREDFPRYEILDLVDGDNRVKIGIISVTLHDNNPDYTDLGPINEDGKAVYEEIKDQCDIVIGMTHLSIGEDRELAKALPELALIMGGHEHQNMEEEVGTVRIAKADANAKSAYIHRFSWNCKTKTLTIDSELKQLDETVPMDAAVQSKVEEWTKIVYDGYEEMGFRPNEIVATVDEPLDGKESTNRSARTNLGTLIAGSFIFSDPNKKADCGLLNSGSIRVDDELSGAISEYDIIRILPFGGPSVVIPMKGSVLREALDIGTAEDLHGNGGYLQYENIAQTDAGWTVNGEAIEDGKTYQVAGTSYLFYNEKPYVEVFADIRAAAEVEANGELQEDIRTGLIAYMKEVYQ